MFRKGGNRRGDSGGNVEEAHSDGSFDGSADLELPNTSAAFERRSDPDSGGGGGSEYREASERTTFRGRHGGDARIVVARSGGDAGASGSGGTAGGGSASAGGARTPLTSLSRHVSSLFASRDEAGGAAHGDTPSELYGDPYNRQQQQQHHGVEDETSGSTWLHRIMSSWKRKPSESVGVREAELDEIARYVQGDLLATPRDSSGGALKQHRRQQQQREAERRQQAQWGGVCGLCVGADLDGWLREPLSGKALRVIESYEYFVLVCVLVAVQYLFAMVAVIVAVESTAVEGRINASGDAMFASAVTTLAIASFFFLEWLTRLACLGRRYVLRRLLRSTIRLVDLLVVATIFALALTAFVLAVHLRTHGASEDIDESSPYVIVVCTDKLIVLRLLTISNLLTSRKVQHRARRSIDDLERTLQRERDEKAAAAAAASAPAAGDTDNWLIDAEEVELGDRLGTGAYGDVYLGLWRGTLVAVKKSNARAHDERVLAEYRAEADTLARLRHPNVLLFVGLIRDARTGGLSIVTEYCPGGDLRRLLHDPALQSSIDARFRLKCAVGAACGMAYLHSMNIVHRDFKTSNLLIAEGNSGVKVCDFGMSGALAENCTAEVGAAGAHACRGLFADPGATADGGNDESEAPPRALGTLQYSAPEMLRSECCDKRSDVYSFGIVLWEIASRSTPYRGVPRYRIMLEVADGRLRPDMRLLSDDRRAVELEYKQLMQMCWQQEPDARPTMNAVLQALVWLVKRLGFASADDALRYRDAETSGTSVVSSVTSE